MTADGLRLCGVNGWISFNKQYSTYVKFVGKDERFVSEK